jgi:hypothetical protein
MARVMYGIFSPSTPVAWADYHIVKERGDKLWIHTHGLRRKVGFELEFVRVPAILRDDAIKLMFALAGHARARRPIEANTDFAGDFSGAWSGFRQSGSFREARHSDPAHRKVLRIVDSGQPPVTDYPRRLFAAHLAARAERTAEISHKVALFGKSLAVFPGDFADDRAGADFDPENTDITDLQNKSNLGAYIGMSRALCDWKRYSEAYEYLLGAVARCPGWARVYRDHLMRSFNADDPYMRYWRDVDIARTRLNRMPLCEPAAPAWKPRQSARFGKRNRNRHLEALGLACLE